MILKAKKFNFSFGKTKKETETKKFKIIHYKIAWACGMRNRPFRSAPERDRFFETALESEIGGGPKGTMPKRAPGFPGA